MRMGLLAVAGWLVAAVLMVAMSWSAIGVVRTAVVPGATVAAGLPTPEETGPTGGPARTPTAPTTVPPTGPPPTAAPGTVASSTAGRTVLASGAGGTAAVRCTRGVPTFLNLTPRQGWSVHRDDGPGEVRFDGPSGARTEIVATCANGTPRTSVEERGARGGREDGDDEGDDGGGRDGDAGAGDGSGGGDGGGDDG